MTKKEARLSVLIALATVLISLIDGGIRTHNLARTLWGTFPIACLATYWLCVMFGPIDATLRCSRYKW